MKSHIRFKVKHLLGVIAAAIGIVALSYVFMPSAMMFIAEGYYREGEQAEAKIYYDRMNQYFPKHWKTPEALERAAQIAESDNLLMVSPMGIGSAPRSSGNVSKEALKYYEILADNFPDTWQGERAIKELAIQEIRNYINLGNISAALEVINNYFEKQTRVSWHYDVILEVARALKTKGYHNEAANLIEDSIENMDGIQNSPDTFELLADIYGVLGNKEKALFNYNRVLESHEEILKLEREYAGDEYDKGTNIYYEEKEDEINRKISMLTTNPINTGSIIGSITIAGKPVAGVEMILQPLPNPNEYSMGSMDAIWLPSNEKGEFSFESIIPGRYGLGFVVDLEQVGDVVLKGGRFPKSIIYVEEGQTYRWDFELVDTMKIVAPADGEVIQGDYIDLTWEPYEGAAYYTLELGTYFENGSGSSGYGEKYYSNSTRFNIQELKSIQTGMSYDEEGPMPQSLFGYAMPGGRFFWSVSAHNHDGNVLSSSQGYLKSQDSDFSFPEEELSEGDKLLLERKYGEAIAAYEKSLEKDTEDIHSMSMLAKLYGISINETIGEYKYSDLDKALEYYHKLYDITGDVGYLDSITGIYYIHKEDFEKALDILKEIEKEQALNDWQKQQVAKLESHFGNYGPALNKLISSERRFLSEEAALRIITGDFSDALNEYNLSNVEEVWQEALSQYERDYAMVDSDLQNSIKDMPALEAITMLDNKDLTPNEEFIKLSLKVLDPTFRRSSTENIEMFINKYSSKDPDLARYAKILFMD
ncbi:MAG: hypothetical protein APF76_06705 [Desulfitibacter sp. BRH_c19]|nr:MAG: hypothetical protein APF76_06705 [Desulfitibacter sp. BRH_c19]